MTTRRAAWLLCFAALAAGRAAAFENSGGPVRTSITLGGKKTEVDVTWAQSGGVVILKIVTVAIVPPEERDTLLEAAKLRLSKRPGFRAGYSSRGQLMIGFRITGYSEEFGNEDLTTGSTSPLAR